VACPAGAKPVSRSGNGRVHRRHLCWHQPTDSALPRPAGSPGCYRAWRFRAWSYVPGFRTTPEPGHEPGRRLRRGRRPHRRGNRLFAAEATAWLQTALLLCPRRRPRLQRFGGDVLQPISPPDRFHSPCWLIWPTLGVRTSSALHHGKTLRRWVVHYRRPRPALRSAQRLPLTRAAGLIGVLQQRPDDGPRPWSNVPWRPTSPQAGAGLRQTCGGLADDPARQRQDRRAGDQLLDWWGQYPTFNKLSRYWLTPPWRAPIELMLPSAARLTPASSFRHTTRRASSTGAVFQGAWGRRSPLSPAAKGPEGTR